ncbi:MAG: hypothetical protein LiPW16_333 [Microgenomates group bacterium LiPW_16]|nr:MAG: hypothetical protein LiPW16_333 [Microgenomates group bacterium LiPW_16]
MISIKEINDKKVWEDFVLSQPQNSFFQSWVWGEVQKAQGYKIWRLGVFDGKRLVGICQVVKVTARRGSFFHLRHGPILAKWQAEYFDSLLTQIREIAGRENIWFIRTSPLLPNPPAGGQKNQDFFKKRGFRPVPIPGQDAEIAWILDIMRPEEELLARMRKTTRYLIRKSQKLGVQVIEGKTEADFDSFFRLYQETAKRQGFVPHRGIREEWKILGKEGNLCLFLAKYQGKILASALIVFYGNQAIYHHSGSLGQFSDIPASYALLWEAIRESKNQGKTIFNFWGIAPPGKPHHPWQGLTLFKTGFGGEMQEFINAYDLPLTPFYWFTYFVETIRRISRGY